jgi:uncharacterized protein (TIGR03437 family)
MRLSRDGRFLINQSGQPVFIAGDSPWSLIVQPTIEEAELYLADRAAKGFNLIIVNLIDTKFSSKAPRNIYSVAPFNRSGDFTTPNEDYFAHADAVIRLAGTKGITVLLDPLYLGWQCGDQGWCAQVQAASLNDMRSWGRYLGNRYKGFANIIWLIGGDTNPFTYNVGEKVEQVVAGIKEYDTTHLITAHTGPGTSAQDIWNGRTWLNLNTIYHYGIGELISMAQREYTRPNALPLFMMETAYEREHDSTPASLRQQAYSGSLWGGTLGSVFGNCPLWSFGFDDGWCVAANWKDQLNSTGSVQFGYFTSLMRSRRFWLLVPDYSHEVVTAGYGSGSTLAMTARASDGSSIITYIPTQRQVTVDLSQIADANKAAKCSWYNPRTGQSTIIGAHATSGSLDFTPPDTNDWVLVIDAATPPLTVVSGATFTPEAWLAPNLIATGFGQNMLSTTATAPSGSPLPTVLAQTSVRVRDSLGADHTAPLWFVSPSQINFLIPELTNQGAATVSVVRQSETIASGTFHIDTVAPGIFTMNFDGRGVPAAWAVLATPGSPQVSQYVFQPGCLPGSCVPIPIDLGSESSRVVLELYGTGIRRRTSLSAVAARIGDVDAPVEYAGPVEGLDGLDQVNLAVPHSLAGRGDVDVVVTVQGKTANTVRINIK